jgi:hypothetical protein
MLIFSLSVFHFFFGESRVAEVNFPSNMLSRLVLPVPHLQDLDRFLFRWVVGPKDGGVAGYRPKRYSTSAA